MKTALLPLAMVFSLAVCADTPPVTEGLVMRVDASDGDSVKRDATGLVYSWQDLADPNNCFTTNEAWFAVNQKWFTDNPHAQPYYDETAFGGKGGVRFGWCRETQSYTPQGLTSTQRILTNRTIFVVFRQDPNANSTTSAKFNQVRGYLLSRHYGSGYDTSIYSDNYGRWCATPGKPNSAGVNESATCWHNGRCIRDGVSYRDVANSTVDSKGVVWKAVTCARGCVELLVVRNNQETYIDSYSGLWVGNKSDSGLTIGHCGAMHSYGTSGCWANRMLHGWVAEELSYDRALSDEELLRVQEWLADKWNVDREVINYRWTGNGGTGLWGDRENWEPEGVPQSASSSVILGTDSVTANGPLAWFKVFYPEGAALTLASGTTISIDYDKTLEIPTCATLSGAVTNTGNGLLCFEASKAAYPTADLHLKAGRLDLRGGHLAFRSVTGDDGYVVNSSAEQATLELTTATAAAKLGAMVVGDVAVVKTGSGDISLDGFLANEGETRLSSGTATVGGEEYPSLSKTCVHLDASDVSTISTNDDGTVWSWRDVHGNGNAFTTNDVNFRTATFPDPTLPLYDPTAFGGKGGVRFGWIWTNAAKTEGAYVPTFLSSLKAWYPTNRTAFVVCMTDAGEGVVQNGNIISRHHGSGLISEIGMSSGEWLIPTKSSPCCSFSLNGVTKLDGWLGVTNANYSSQGYRVPSLGGGVVQLLAFRNAQDYVDDYSAFWVARNGVANCDSLVVGRCGSEYSSYIKQRFAGWIGEIITFDRVLTDGEFNRMQRYLMKKWNVTVEAETPATPQNQLSRQSTLVLEKDANLDLNGVTQTVAAVSLEGSAEAANGALVAESLVVKAAEDRTVPCLTVDEGWDLTGMSVDFTGKPAPGSVFLRATGASTFVGPFAETHGWPIKCRGKSVKLAGGGILLLVR